MPADRLFHPRLGHSRKVSALSHLECRVWTQVILSSDDFGVISGDFHRISADNLALARETPETIQACLDRLVTIGLVTAFEHQDARYFFQRDWQDFQKVEYPRVTIQPRPPAALLKTCTLKTRQLFVKHPGGTGKLSPKLSRRFADDSPTTRARTPAKRLTANGQRLTAEERESEGKHDQASDEPSPIQQVVARLKSGKESRSRVRFR